MKNNHFVSLKPMNLGDLDVACEWYERGDLGTIYINSPLFGAQGVRKYLEGCVNDPSDCRYFMIMDVKSNEPIGHCSLEYIDWQNRNANFGISLGYNVKRKVEHVWEAWIKTVVYAFNVLNLHRIEIRVYSVNRLMDKIVKSGMEIFLDDDGKCVVNHEGTLKECAYMMGKYVDCNVYSLFQRDVDIYKNVSLQWLKSKRKS